MEGAPATFVLMGNFKSPTGPGSNADPAAMRTNFAALAGVLSQYPTLQVWLAGWQQEGIGAASLHARTQTSSPAWAAPVSSS